MPKWAGPSEEAALADIDKKYQELEGLLEMVRDASPNATADPQQLGIAKAYLNQSRDFARRSLSPTEG
jgi:hypothetical protein